MVSFGALLLLSAGLSLVHGSALASPPLPLNCSIVHTPVGSGTAGMPDSRFFNLDIYSPESDGSCGVGILHPVIFFVTGFGGNVPATLYSDLLTRVAQRGFIVIAMHRFGMPNYPVEGGKFLEYLQWAQAGHLEALMSQQKLVAVPDVHARAAVMAQSAGNHVIGEALVANCSIVKAFVMIDPVDGVDPYGIISNQDLIIPGTMLNFSTPALLLDNGLDPQTLHSFYPPCAPAKYSNDRFYNAWAGPIWNINATAYGHIDCTDDGAVGGGSWICPSNPKTDKGAYRAMLADAATTFLLALFEDTPDQLKLLEDPSHFSVDVTMKHDLKGLTYSQIRPGCINTPAQASPLVV